MKHKLKKLICECGNEFTGHHRNGHCPECRKIMTRCRRQESYERWFREGRHKRKQENIEFTNDPNMENAIYC